MELITTGMIFQKKRRKVRSGDRCTPLKNSIFIIGQTGKITMPIRVGSASDYNKNHPDHSRKTRKRETVVLVANKKYVWADCDEHIVELAPRLPT
jgi:hypothetical protein